MEHIVAPADVTINAPGIEAQDDSYFHKFDGEHQTQQLADLASVQTSGADIAILRVAVVRLWQNAIGDDERATFDRGYSVALREVLRQLLNP